MHNIKQTLNKYVETFNTEVFIENDPIQIPHGFSKREDIEIAGFLAATIAWGQRKSIINNAKRLMEMMENSPYLFVTQANSATDWQPIKKFVHRTFNGEDCLFFLHSLRNIYLKHNGLETVFTKGFERDSTIFGTLAYFRKIFLELPHEKRVEKHLSDVSRGSAAKRLNMFLRWMVRQDRHGVDFGLWQNIPAAALMLPLDVHSSSIARKLGLLTRPQNDWKAVEEITAVLREFDPQDPVKYDFALFGIGVNRVTQLS
ncbi:MAG: TIGR02757 family protein [Prevotellaceae bacterium]|nr:TIGR02757 family protein [Prevotellaceae bacterium]